MRSSLKYILIMATALILGIALAVVAQTAIPYQATSPIKSTDPHMSPFRFSPDTINWGIVTITVPVTRQVNITNIGTEPLRLNTTSTNATGALEDGVYALTWDAENMSLPSNGWLLANFTLTISTANITVSDKFSVDIQIGDQT